jgi:hypothetical protein
MDAVEQPEQEHIFLSLRPLSRAGRIAFMVRLATPIHENQRDSACKVELQIETSDDELRLFPQGMKNLLEGTLPELILGR